jgi:ribosomal-protein-alanine N-acetyltransferase
MLALRTQRLTLIANDTALIEAQLSDLAGYFARIGAAPVPQWPAEPFGPETLDWVKASFDVDPTGAGWYGWVMLADAGEGAPRRVVGAAALVGRPDDEGDVELGFGFLPEYAAQGLAAEIVQTLSSWALMNGARRVIAYFDEADDASAHELRESGFKDTREPPYPGVARWALAA